MVGLSIRTMIVNAFFQVVIFLYLMDNDTSFMILASNGVGLAIEFWKILKAFKFSFAGGEVSWGEKEDTKAETESKEYDEIATTHLLYITGPLMVGYSTYSLMNMAHKSWCGRGRGRARARERAAASSERERRFVPSAGRARALLRPERRRARALLRPRGWLRPPTLPSFARAPSLAGTRGCSARSSASSICSAS
jgi:hypothetical protein